jgi:phage terminase large subunit
VTQPNPFDQFLADYRNNPARFVREVLGVEPDRWQEEFLTAIAEGNRRISIRSGHGVGKSSSASWAMIWFVLTRYPVKVVVTAPTSAQLYDALFAECKRWVKELPPALQQLLEVKQERIELKASGTEAFISARTSRAEQPEALQGIHSEHVLLIADEASGVPESVFEAAAGSMSGHSACTILLGNPTKSSGFFFDTHHRLKNEWWTRRVSCADSPRVSAEYIAEMALRYGEDSNAYRIRVLGEFPRSDDDTIISVELVEGAMHRDTRSSPTAPVVWGLDVARFGSDKSALAKRQANVVHEIRTWAGLDLMQLSGAVVAEYESTPSNVRPAEILVDSIGLGAGVVDRLRELGLPARGINVSESPALGATYTNLRAELWFRAKGWLEARDCKLPKNEDLMAELVGPRFSFTSNGKMQVESKDAMRKRGLGSPDMADALCLTFASNAATALYGRSMGGAWSKPIRRGIPRIA